MVTGVDVSSNNGPVNWSAIWRAGYRFAYIKASEGLDWNDPRFRENWVNSGQAGLLRGAYHFARPQPGRTGAQEAAHMCEVCAQLGAGARGHLPPALDLETGHGLAPAQIHAWAGSFVAEVERRLGRTPVIYTGGFWKSTLGNPKESWNCPLWLAQWGSTPTVPAAWSHWTIWQHTASGEIPNVPGKKWDLNRFDGSIDDLQALAQLGRKSGGGTGPHEHGAHAWPGRVLALGVSGDDVHRWQTKMRERGFTNLVADGSFGATSVHACRQLQMYKQLKVDGRVGARTWAATWGPP
jgi:GH25 family lysozyme M1 (1,4-beta-N-acetylmuramidase)